MILRVLFFVFFLVSACSLHAEVNKITVGYIDYENYPFQTGVGTEVNWPNPGILVEQIKHVGETLSVELEFKRVPWVRGLQLLKAGRLDALFAASYKEERWEFGVYPSKNGQVDPEMRLYELDYVLYKRKGSAVSWDGRYLLNVNTAGAIRGYSVVSDLRNLGVTIEEVDDDLQSIKKLVSKRIDAVASFPYAIEAIKRKDPERYRDVELVQPPLKTKPLYLMFSHQFYDTHKPFAEQMWAKVAEVRGSEFTQGLYIKYLDEFN